MGKRGYIIVLVLVLFYFLVSSQAVADLVPTTFGFPVIVGGFPVAESYDAATTFNQPNAANALFGNNFMANFGISRGSLTIDVLPAYTSRTLFSNMNAFPAFDNMLDFIGDQNPPVMAGSPTLKPNPAPVAVPTPPTVPAIQTAI